MTKINEIIKRFLFNTFTEKMPRGFKTRGKKIVTFEIDPLYPIMDFPKRDFNYKYFAGEMAWYIKKENTTDFIKKFSSFWENIKNPDGKTINSNYGHILLGNHPSSETAKNQLAFAFNSLVKDRDSRQAVAFLNCPYFQFEGNKDFVCTMYLNFFIEEGKLNMKVQMRSNDIFFGLSYDAPFFSSIMQSMYLNLKNIYEDLELGTYYHCADDIHYYERHFDLVDVIKNTPSEKDVRMELSHPLFHFVKTGESYSLALSASTLSFAEDVELVANTSSFKNIDEEGWKAILSKIVTFETSFGTMEELRSTVQ